jgi:alpha-glucosidase
MSQLPKRYFSRDQEPTTYIMQDSSNYSYYILPEDLVQKPAMDTVSTPDSSAFNVTWSNDPTFGFSVVRKSTGDVLFSTLGSKLVYENQFIEFVTSMPNNYNVYGLGERIHGLRLGNNFTATTYAADAGTPLDYNIYGTHP